MTSASENPGALVCGGVRVADFGRADGLADAGHLLTDGEFVLAVKNSDHFTGPGYMRPEIRHAEFVLFHPSTGSG